MLLSIMIFINLIIYSYYKKSGKNYKSHQKTISIIIHHISHPV